MFWDASALIPLVVKEHMTTRLRGLPNSEPRVVWWASRVECASAMARTAREGRLGPREHDAALERLVSLFNHCVEVQPIDRVRDRALRLLRVHPLRAADSLQLAAALAVCEEQPAGVGFVSLDERLRTAAGNEGFSVLP